MTGEMNLYAFIASLVASLVSLAWPAALVIIVWMFKRDLKALLPRARFKYGDAELGFLFEQAEVKAAEIQAAAPPRSDIPQDPDDKDVDDFIRSLRVSPHMAVMLERTSLIEALQERVDAVFGPGTGQRLGFSASIERLREKGELPEMVYQLLEQLRVLGNAVHQSREATEEEAWRYRNLAHQAKAVLKYW